MNYKRFLGTASTALLIIIVITLVLAPGAGAQSKYKTLYKFKGSTDGGYPNGLISDPAGNLYGTTYAGGNVSVCPNHGSGPGCGTVFKMTPNSDGTWSESVLYSFCATDCRLTGGYPDAGLIFDQAGNLYGTTQQGGSGFGGTVFKLTPNSDGTWSESVLYSFCPLEDCSDGALPSGLIFDQAGNLYGTTAEGGSRPKCNDSGCGVVFKLTPNQDGAWSESLLYRFCSLKQCSDGALPRSRLLFDARGNLYGTAGGGGDTTCRSPLQDGCGVVFKLTPNLSGTWKEKVLHHFMGGWDGAGPSPALILDHAGNLYGTTVGGGNPICYWSHGCGLVFELIPNSNGSWREKVLRHFAGGTRDGGNPLAGLVFDQAGNLYGTNSFGGTYGNGAIFALTPNPNGPWREKVLHQVRRGQAGAVGNASLIFDAAGNLYGTLDGYGVTTRFGSVFEITP